MYTSQIETAGLPVTKKDTFARSLLISTLGHLKNASLTLVDCDGQTHQLGEHGADLHAEIIVRHPGLYQRILSGGSIAASEAYVDGWWDSPDLTRVIQVICRNLDSLDRLESKVGWMGVLARKVSHWQNRNTKDNARSNISAHYDLGNNLYASFLDEEMLYSSGIYENDSDSLEEAQFKKMDRLCQQLNLQPSDHLIEIGTGWGAMAIHAAKHYGCHVTTTTISEEQYQWAQSRIVDEGLTHKITLLKKDYRDLDGQYDKLVSIEMIEAVGKQFLPTYIQTCQSLLKPDGLMAIQAITIADQRYDSYSKNVDFIQKHIFPGGFLPSVNVLLEQFTRQSDFVVRDMKDIGMDYAKTLQDWHVRFAEKQDELEDIGYDERFSRLWRYYFCYCEGGFLERTISTVQLVLSRSGWRG
ncbi:cyclopropane-fatty-acyl-phospholipid synthase family protein [Enterovibrio sp. ZSDZ35]|uniref:Cyclopropane-fatty-acyl-phospholipid synthase family protein n=1 Tax=Enterovibrio qingdaonensis TaxID=2899818 RepID=A0ABT5QF83_9GAMM|nr:cyclopropane-fatty-acyl-phospholipid synthase [Enterovibrio sp. ZSDZ35]MDD1779642.1 cyclopropane-fatty-acyl-phospholipid synthase family protein [Enterovibrio sp. ZSDZ35]